MPDYEMRIEQMPVNQNRKCEGCVHYNGNAASKGGVCEVGKLPTSCGSGDSPKYGYAPLSELRADEIDDFATPVVSGMQGVMNEQGKIESIITMKTVNLGDEDIAWAKQIQQRLSKSGMHTSQDMFMYQGQTNLYAPEAALHQLPGAEPEMFRVAKALHEEYFAPRKQKKFSIGQVLEFLAHNGMNVTDEDYSAAGVQKGGARESGSKAKPKVKKVSGGDDDEHGSSNKKPKTSSDEKESPHGGNVIGHTRSGKPVFGPDRSVLDRADEHVRSHEAFTADDHSDAAKFHTDRSRTEAADLGPAYRAIADSHRAASVKTREKQKRDEMEAKANPNKKPSVKKAG